MAGRLRPFRQRPFALALTSVLSGACAAGGPGARPPDWPALRRQMVQEQLVERGIADPRVLAALGQVPRHEFVPAPDRARAYTDQPLPIGRGQTISQPYIVALMSELAGLRGEERVLEVGTGSGYQAAVLSLLAHDVYTIEIDPALADEARQRLKQLGFTNVAVRAGDGFYGWPEAGPFDVIIVTAAAPRVPERLVAQLREGGRVVIPIGSDQGQQLMVGLMQKGTLRLRPASDVLFVPMTGEIRTPARR